MLDVIQYIEHETALVKGRGAKTKSIVQVHYDVGDKDIDSRCGSPEGQGPQLHVFVKDGHFDVAVIVADTIIINTQAMDIVQALLLLLATYFVFDLFYPRPYCQILGFLQQQVLDQLYSGLKSQNFTSFVSRFPKVN